MPVPVKDSVLSHSYQEGNPAMETAPVAKFAGTFLHF